MISTEPEEAFPYTPPTDQIKSEYAHLFELTDPLPPRFFKVLFDKVLALILLTISLPILLILKFWVSTYFEAIQRFISLLD